MQQLKTEIIIQIPEDSILIKKVDYEALKEQADEVWVGGLNWLVAQTSIGNKQTLREILYANRKEIEDFVLFPSVDNGKWMFNSVPMKQWLRSNFKRVLAK